MFGGNRQIWFKGKSFNYSFHRIQQQSSISNGCLNYSLSMPEESLAQLVTRALSAQTCPEHAQPLTHFSLTSGEFICLLCDSLSKIPIAELIENPVTTLLDFQECPRSLYAVYRNIKPHDRMFKTLESLVKELREKLNSYCDGIIQRYSEAWVGSRRECEASMEMIRDVENRYRYEFESLLECGFEKGLASELEQIVRDFKQHSENPTHFLETHVLTIHQQLQKVPLINWDKLQSLYVEASNPCLWQPDQFFQEKPLSTAEGEYSMTFRDNLDSSRFNVDSRTNILKDLIPNMLNQLRDPQYCLYFNETQTKLMKAKQAIDQSLVEDSLCLSSYEPECQLTMRETNDSYCQLDRYRLLGIGYQKLNLYSYETGKLVKQASYDIEGCTSVLFFGPCLIAVASGRLWRIWLEDGYSEMIGAAEGELRAEEGGKFVYKSMDGRQHCRFALHGGC